MADAGWTNYVGAVTGVVALAVSVITYRRANQIKSLDMRLELRKVLSQSHQSLNDLRSLIDYAAGSRRAVLALRGNGRSGAMEAWEHALTTDRTEIDRIAAALRSEDADFSTLSSERLESELAASYKLRTTLSALVQRYRGEVTADNDTRRQIGDQQTAIAAARIQAARPPRG